MKKDITTTLTQIQLYFNTIVLLFNKTQFHNIYKLNYKIPYTKNKLYNFTYLPRQKYFKWHIINF